MTDDQAQWTAAVKRETRRAGHALVGLARARRLHPELYARLHPRPEATTTEPPTDQLQHCDDKGI